MPEHVRSDNGPEFVAKAVQDWIGAVGAKTAYIERGSPWENGLIVSVTRWPPYEMPLASVKCPPAIWWTPDDDGSGIKQAASS